MSDFATLTDPYRRELLAHCYRMLGSIHDAEDLVQETYLRAWRAFDRFEGRSSVRVWLYQIATRACLTALEAGKRRAMPSGLGAPAEDHRVALGSLPSVEWLEPAPSGIFGDPAAIVEQRSGVRLAFIAALQRLSARQRAVLILRDVLQWRAAEVATVLDTSTVAVNSALQRARLAIGDDVGPDDPPDQALLDRYVTAFQEADLDLLVSLLRADVELEMPPQPVWFSGRDAVAGFLRARVLRRSGTFRLVPTSANGRPAFLVYEGGTPHGVQVPSVLNGRVARIVAFNDPRLVPYFETAVSAEWS